MLFRSSLGIELDTIREEFDRAPTDRTLEVAFGTVEAGTCGALWIKAVGVVDGEDAIVVEHVTRLVRDTAPWTLLGLMLVLTTGPLIFSSGPATYVYNSSFHYKMTALAVGILYNWTVHKKVANSPDPGRVGVLVGAFSILLWASIIFAGIFIAFV